MYGKRLWVVMRLSLGFRVGLRVSRNETIAEGSQKLWHMLPPTNMKAENGLFVDYCLFKTGAIGGSMIVWGVGWWAVGSPGSLPPKL